MIQQIGISYSGQPRGGCRFSIRQSLPSPEYALLGLPLRPLEATCGYDTHPRIAMSQLARESSIGPGRTDARNSFAAPAFYRIADVMRITALSRATLYRRIADGKFPAPIHLGGRACGWTPAALQTWIDDPEGYTAPATPAIAAQRGRICS
jgi:predicted DNA-binding transcriptional regulator AlpA